MKIIKEVILNSKTSVLFLVLFCWFGLGVKSIHAQKEEITTNKFERPSKSLYLDGGGGGSWFSGNFEKTFFSREHSFFNFRFGLGYMEERGDSIPSSGEGFFESFDYEFKNSVKKNHHLTIPSHLTFNIGKGRVYAEIGLHFTYYPRETWDKVRHTIGPLIGFRLLPPQDQGFLFRAYVNMPYEGFNTYNWYLPFGISLGYSFE